jgi:hypothetical protein
MGEGGGRGGGGGEAEVKRSQQTIANRKLLVPRRHANRRLPGGAGCRLLPVLSAAGLRQRRVGVGGGNGLPVFEPAGAVLGFGLGADGHQLFLSFLGVEELAGLIGSHLGEVLSGGGLLFLLVGLVFGLGG